MDEEILGVVNEGTTRAMNDEPEGQAECSVM